jgi:uncharacterized protein (TIGR04255 family)
MPGTSRIAAHGKAAHLVHPLIETKFPQLSHPPLREALVDIKLRDVLPATWMERLENANFGDFTNPQPMKQSAFKFVLPKDEPARALVDSDQPLGRRYNSKDEARVLQVRRNGMTLSILKNYTNWEALRDSARASWERYLEISGSVDVDRLAVRYTNAIEMPVGDDYDKYLTAAPRIPRELPQIVNNFIQRVELPFIKEEAEATAIITQTLGQTAGGKGSVILDIDVFCQCALKGTSPDIWFRLDNLRDIATGIFFSSVTQEVLKSYS